MCGIFGLFSKDKKIDGNEILEKIGIEILNHRGPDGFGYYSSSNVFLAHWRLAIIDLKGGSQPMNNKENTISIVFNGEIYNFQELRKELESCGHEFRTLSDTEVIIHAYEEWDMECVSRFRGMFAFAIWDSRKNCMYLARDRLGIKPLFYAVHNNIIYFASEMKAILAQSQIPKDINFDAIAWYFSLGYIPAPFTIYKNIQKLPAGYTLKIDRNGKQLNKYWDVQYSPNNSKSSVQFWDEFKELFRESVALRMISDVPIGAFLSGGIDSGIVVAFMSLLSNKPIRTFTIGFGGEIGGYFDERALAKTVSQRYGTEHFEYVIYPKLSDIIGKIVNAFDEPFADDSVIPSYYLSKKTREQVAVSLSGLGGDETFGGYERYLGFKLSSYYKLLPFFFRENVIRKLIEMLPERADGHYTINHLKRFVRGTSYSPFEMYYEFISMVNNRKNLDIFKDSELMKAHFKNVMESLKTMYETAPADDPLDKIFYMDLKTYLADDVLALTDRMSMQHSLEVRVPFIDHKIIEFCATIPNHYKIRFFSKKYLLRQGAKEFLPPQVLNHRKQGFSSPMSQWIKFDLKSHIDELLSENALKISGIFDQKKVRTILDEHYSRREINDRLIWAIVIFQEWYKQYMLG